MKTVNWRQYCIIQPQDMKQRDAGNQIPRQMWNYKHDHEIAYQNTSGIARQWLGKRLDDPGFISQQGRETSSSPKGPDRLWSSPSLLFRWYRGSVLGVKRHTINMAQISYYPSRSPRGRRRGSATVHLLRFRVRIPPGRMDVCPLWVMCVVR